MPRRQFIAASQLPVSAAEAFAWHARHGAFQRLLAPWEPVEIVEQRGTVRDGDRLTVRVRLAPGVWKRWVAEHNEFVEGRQFVDEQIEGPFKFWEHVHQFEPRGDKSCTLEDRIDYELPLGAVGEAAAGRAIRRRLDRLFAYRHRTARDDLREHHKYLDRPRQRVLITGASGLIGSVLSAFLSAGGHAPVGLTRRRDNLDSIVWNPEKGEIDAEALEGFDAVIHLAGENVAGGRWTEARKKKILESRERGTRFLCESLVKLKRPPKTLLSASAVGYYGTLADEEADESSRRGGGFLAEVCEAWEAATEPARAAGIRVVNTRFGVVLTPAGGALKKMLPPFMMGVGGRLGDGQQWMSWISPDDVAGAVHHCLMHDELTGPVNVCAPQPVTNGEFTLALGRVLGRPTILPMPGFAARAAFGEMADEMLLGGQRVVPRRLTESGYSFRFPELEGALRHVLGKTTRDHE